MSGPNWSHQTIWTGDNLPVLRGMNTETVDLIATDPPFNKSRDFHATPDSLAAGAKFQDRWSWEDDIQVEWIDQITDDYPKLMQAIESARFAHSDGMGAFMCFMAVRLLEMKRVLKETGSIYLHCDPTASHYIKAVMDATFGQKNFRNEVIWSYRSGGGSKKGFGKKHDIIFWYSRDPKLYVFNHNAMRIPYDAVIAKKRSHLFHKKGKVSGDVWDISRPPNHSKEWLGYPTQKPLALYKRIIKASSKEGDTVLDPFCGCATTLVAAENLEREWVGIDIWKRAHELVVNRLSDTTGIFGDVHYVTEPPERTDKGETSAPFLRVRERVQEPDGPEWTRKKMYEHLLNQYGCKCQGCDRIFDDPRYLELDHNTPRSDGGLNHISNRILLCSPCNRLKSNDKTLTGLRRANKNLGYMRTGI